MINLFAKVKILTPFINWARWRQVEVRKRLWVNAILGRLKLLCIRRSIQFTPHTSQLFNRDWFRSRVIQLKFTFSNPFILIKCCICFSFNYISFLSFFIHFFPIILQTLSKQVSLRFSYRFCNVIIFWSSIYLWKNLISWIPEKRSVILHLLCTHLFSYRWIF